MRKILIGTEKAGGPNLEVDDGVDNDDVNFIFLTQCFNH
jgi:hypothetical protein